MLLPWLGLAVAALLGPRLLRAPLGLGDPWVAAFGKPLDALLPVAAGALAAAALARWGARLPAVPEGDILALSAGRGVAAGALAAAVGRAEASLRAWPAAGLALLGLVAALAGAMLLSAG